MTFIWKSWLWQSALKLDFESWRRSSTGTLWQLLQRWMEWFRKTGMLIKWIDHPIQNLYSSSPGGRDTDKNIIAQHACIGLNISHLTAMHRIKDGWFYSMWFTILKWFFTDSFDTFRVQIGRISDSFYTDAHNIIHLPYSINIKHVVKPFSPPFLQYWQWFFETNLISA